MIPQSGLSAYCYDTFNLKVGHDVNHFVARRQYIVFVYQSVKNTHISLEKNYLPCLGMDFYERVTFLHLNTLKPNTMLTQVDIFRAIEKKCLNRN